jgi:peptidoglycan hydrolase-like protein with peptidoglycan-binding domain
VDTFVLGANEVVTAAHLHPGARDFGKAPAQVADLGDPLVTMRPILALPAPFLRARWVVLLAVAAVLSCVAPAQAATQPGTPTTLPAQIERLAPYVAASSCDPTAKPGVVELGELLKATYPTTSYGISRTCGTDPLPTSEHYDGRAIDWFTSARTTAGRARARAVISWLFATDAAGNRYANARRLGVMYIIWNNRIWGSYRADEGWRPYSTCASHPERSWDTTCHRDHVHFSLSWEGAMGRTSFWTGTVAAQDYGPCRPPDLNWAAPYSGPNPTPCPDYPTVKAPAGSSALTKTLYTYSGMVLRRGSTGPVVTAVQRAIGTTADGSFGPVTESAVEAFQSAHGVAQTGVVDAATWRALLTGTTPPVQQSVTTTSPLTRYLGVVLRRGSHGPAVRALQHRLHIGVTGHFNRHTKHRVQRFQRHHHLRATGVVRRSTWRALGA